MGENMAVDAVASVVRQKLEGLVVDESSASNKRIGHRLKKMQKALEKSRSSLAKAADQEEIERLATDYLADLYSMEDSIETRFTRRRKKLGFLTHKFYASTCIRTKVKELDSRSTSSLDGSKRTVESSYTPRSDGVVGEREGNNINEIVEEEEMENTSLKCTKSGPSVSSKTQKSVRFNTPIKAFKVLKRSKTSVNRERMEQSALVFSYSYNEKNLSTVGNQRKAEQLRKRLNDIDGWIIPLIGEPGSGKTTMARAVYGDRAINNKFNAAAWADIFKESKTTDILLSLLNQVKKKSAVDGSSHEQLLKNKLSQELTDQSYLIVLDGVQTLDQWISLKAAFPKQRGSRIILITSDEGVAEHDDPKWQPFHLEKLTFDESWTLFMRKVGLQEDPKDFDLTNKITEACQGLPLNIVLLGSLLSMKDKEEWRQILVPLNSHRNWQASNILTLCYNDLDNRLKICLMYMTLFPKDMDIPVRRLQRLWLAEGFVEKQQGVFQEDVAQKHFEDLVKRSLIMVSKQRSDGSPRKCRLLGALHDILSAEAQAISLFHAQHGPDCQIAASFSIRRLVEHAGSETGPLEPSQSQLVRSYISFNYQKKDTPAKYVNSLVSKMVGKGLGLLRVLDLEGVYKPGLPENLGDLFHLRYLGLRWTFLDKLPKSVGKLPYLETLDLKHTLIDKIPASIWKLRELKHLNLQEVHLDKDTALHFTNSLPKLQTLWGLSVSHESPIKNGLSKLKHLRELGISFRLIKRCDDTAGVSRSTSPAQSTEALVEWISMLKDLRSLRLRSMDDTGSPADISLKPFTNLEHLSHMKILGMMQKLPPVDQFPPNIKVLTLSLSNLKDDPMQILGNLPSLKVLRLLGNSFCGDTMVCEKDTFKNLEVLKLWALENLKSWEVEEGAMVKLKEVNIRFCRELENFPDRLLQQKTFKELILNDMLPAFEESIKKNYQSKLSVKNFKASKG